MEKRKDGTLSLDNDWGTKSRGAESGRRTVLISNRVRQRRGFAKKALRLDYSKWKTI